MYVWSIEAPFQHYVKPVIIYVHLFGIFMWHLQESHMNKITHIKQHNIDNHND